MNSGKNNRNSSKSDTSSGDKAVNRYVFTCIGMIMYIMPCLSCLGIGMVSEGGVSPAFIFAIVVELLSIPVGLMGINALKKPGLRMWCILCAGILMALHVVCAVMLLTWYLIMAPTFILLALYIAWSNAVNTK